MESPVKGTIRKKNFVTKTWARFRYKTTQKNNAVPEGFFPVHVGPEKQWFAMEMKYLNHPLFGSLLEDAEIEYGYQTPGPISLPCEVHIFYRVVAEMEAKEMKPYGRGFGQWLRSPFSPGRAGRQSVKTLGDQMVKGYGDYGILTPSRLVIKMN